MIYVLIIPVAAYFVLASVAFVFAESLIFQPQAASYADDRLIIKLRSADGSEISARFFSNDRARYTILFSHGNAEDIGTSEGFLKELSERGFNVLTYDYRGYGTSSGSPSEENSCEDIESAYNYLVNDLETPPERIILHGRSLGGAVSIDLASRKGCGGLVVESSFASAFRVLTGFKLLPFDRFENLKKMGKVKCPVLVIHGRQDSLIRPWHGEALFDRANEPKSAYWVEQANHNDVFAISPDAYLKAIQEFAETVRRSVGGFRSDERGIESKIDSGSAPKK